MMREEKGQAKHLILDNLTGKAPTRDYKSTGLRTDYSSQSTSTYRDPNNATSKSIRLKLLPYRFHLQHRCRPWRRFFDSSKAVRDAQPNGDLPPLILRAGNIKLCISHCESSASMHAYLCSMVHQTDIIQDSTYIKDGKGRENC